MTPKTTEPSRTCSNGALVSRLLEPGDINSTEEALDRATDFFLTILLCYALRLF